MSTGGGRKRRLPVTRGQRRTRQQQRSTRSVDSSAPRRWPAERQAKTATFDLWIWPRGGRFRRTAAGRSAPATVPRGSRDTSSLPLSTNSSIFSVFPSVVVTYRGSRPWFVFLSTPSGAKNTFLVLTFLPQNKTTTRKKQQHNYRFGFCYNSTCDIMPMLCHSILFVCSSCKPDQLAYLIKYKAVLENCIRFCFCMCACV